jgi:DNA-binding CsgD family transcriptional regulator
MARHQPSSSTEDLESAGTTALPELTFEPVPRDAFLGISSFRIRQILKSLEAPGSCIVLTGEPGCGKSYLAQAAALEFRDETHPDDPIKRLTIESLDELVSTSTGASLHPRDEAERILTALEANNEQKTVLIIALNIDRYDATAATVLEYLVASGRVRMLCTARTVTGAADRLARHPGVHQLAVQPLTEAETEAFLARLWKVERVTPTNLNRWYRWTRGNQHALTTLALASERRGAVQRAGSLAWVAARTEQVPADFVTQLGPLSPAEQASLELVVYADPLHEPELLQLLDATAVNNLLQRQVLAVRTEPGGITALTTRLPVIAAAVLGSISPVRRAALATACFRALDESDSYTATARGDRQRIVRFGIESGSSMPIDWVWAAMKAGSRSGDLEFKLSLAFIAMQHEDPLREAEAIQQACDLAFFLGDSGTLGLAIEALHNFLSAPEKIEAVPFHLWARLAISSVYFHPSLRGRPTQAIAALTEWESVWTAQKQDGKQLLRVAETRLLAFNGKLRAAFEVCAQLTEPKDFNAELVLVSAHTVEALIRIQRGEFSTALSIAERARDVVLLHDLSPTFSGDLEGFVTFLAHWARGTMQSARRALEVILAPLRADLSAIRSHTGLSVLAICLLALQEGRWNDAADHSERLIGDLAVNDPYRILALTHSVAALAWAALGDDVRAHSALDHSSLQSAGISQALRGYKEIFALRARHWLRDPHLIEYASELANWARLEELPLIELSALNVMAQAQNSPDSGVVTRAVRLASLVDGPIGGAVLAHIQSMSGEQHSDSEPEERLLSELGIWSPLPRVERLTAREREIALFTSLGYSSKFIAERLHLSARTVETHLSHTYAKLEIANREDLRKWFSRQRESTE